MNKGIIFKGVVSFTFLFLVACAPIIDGAKSAISGNAKVEYAATASEVITAINGMANQIQVASYYSPFFVESKTANSIVLIARPLSGSAVYSSPDAKRAPKIKITVTTENRGGYIHVVFSPNPSSDQARAAQQQFIDKLDEKFSRYHAEN